jgi:hypothetical protein
MGYETRRWRWEDEISDYIYEFCLLSKITSYWPFCGDISVLLTARNYLYSTATLAHRDCFICGGYSTYAGTSEDE